MDRSSRMMYLPSSSSIVSNGESAFPFRFFCADPMVATGFWLLDPPLPSDGPFPWLLPKTEFPKSFLTTGKRVGMQVPIRTKFASMLDHLSASHQPKAKAKGTYLVQRTTSSTAYVKSVRVK